jgi:transcriptional regulator with GAF, ATPase, and Fis domain
LTGGSSSEASLGRALPSRIRSDKSWSFSQRFQPQTITLPRKTIQSTCPSKQNCERAVILSPGKVLRAPLAELKEPADRLDASSESAAPKAITLKDAEREHIIRALAETNWVIGEPKGAGARLGLQRTTLISKMQRLGISRAQA